MYEIMQQARTKEIWMPEALIFPECGVFAASGGAKGQAAALQP
jgi:hypothetical protein